MSTEITKSKEQLVAYQPEVIVLPTPQEVDQFAASRFVEQVTSKPHSVLTLPTGATARGMYKLLIKMHQQMGIDYSGLTVFNLDEYWPLDASHDASYASYMWNNFFKYVNIPAHQRHIPNSEAADPNIEAARFEALINQYHKDLTVLGIGPGTTCHIGFNEVGSTRNSRTRYMALDAQTMQANAQFFQNPAEIPAGSLTQGIGNILEAERIILLAKGKGKAWGIKRTLEGPIGSDAPASFLRLHPRATFVLDQAAAHLLK